MVADLLAPQVTAIDMEGRYPEDVLRALGRAGAFAAHLPSRHDGRPPGMATAIEAMAAVGEHCGSTSFLSWCQSVCAWYLEQTDNAALRDAALPGIASAATLGGTALSNPMKHYAGIEPLRLSGRRVPDGFRVSGAVPWVSNLGAGHRFGIIFSAGDRAPHHVMALAHCDAEGAALAQNAHFAALEGTRTFSVRFDDVLVPDEAVLADPVADLLPRIRPGFVLMQAGMALGLVRGCIAIMERAANSRGVVNAHLPTQPAAMADALAALQADVELLAATPTETDESYWLRVLQARLRASELSLEAATAAMLHAGASGFLVQAPAQRRLREATFIAIVTHALKHLRQEIARLG